MTNIKSILEMYQGKRILVTGATGFIGTNILRTLDPIECEIIRLSRQHRLTPYTGKKAKVTDLIGDIRERPIWEDSLKDADVVFHLAAQTSIAMSEEDSYEDFNCNVLPLIHLLNICREKSWSPTIIFAGTVTSVGIPKKLPVNEDHRDDPLTPYCLHKLTAEKYLKDYVRLGAVRGAVLRLANVYGPGPEVSKSDRGVLNKMIQRAKEGETLYLYGNRKRLRDYIYIEDVVKAFLTAGANINNINGEHFVIGTGCGYSLEDSFKLVAKQVGKIVGKKIKVKYRNAPDDFPTIEERNFVADPTRFIRKTGWKPFIDLESGINRTLGVLT